MLWSNVCRPFPSHFSWYLYSPLLLPIEILQVLIFPKTLRWLLWEIQPQEAGINSPACPPHLGSCNSCRLNDTCWHLLKLFSFPLIISLTPTQLKNQVFKEGCPNSHLSEPPSFPMELAPWLYTLIDTHFLPVACPQLILTYP